MHTLIAYSESQDTAVLANVAAVDDDHVNASGDDIRVPPRFNQIGGVFAGGPTITAARIVSPSLRDLANLDVSPVNIGAEPLDPTPFLDIFHTPISLTIGENLRAQTSEGAGGAERETVGVFLVDGPPSPVTGDITSVRATGTTTLVASAWTRVPLTFGQDLPAGRYQLVGARVIGATAVLARFIIPGLAHRPGCIAYDAADDVELPIFRMGKLGVWAEFDTVQGIAAEILANAGDTAQTVFLDVLRIGPLAAA